MEQEIRFYYTLEEYDTLLEKYKNNPELKYEGCFFERTIQYDNPKEEFSFYSKEIDGRFRVRTSKNILTNEAFSKISWKRRLKDSYSEGIHREEEIELDFDYAQYENLEFLLENVIKMKKVESYERYRNVFIGDCVEIVIDKFPFAVALEIEIKAEQCDAVEKINEWLNKLSLNKDESYPLSWDDKYREICLEKGEEQKRYLTF